MSKFNKSDLSVLVLFCLTISVNAQISFDPLLKRAQNVVYMVVGGGATYISYEYERLFSKDKPIFIAAGAGLGAATDGDGADFMTMPFHVSGNVGKRASIFEFGLGTTFIFKQQDRNPISYLILGYRLSLPKKHKLNFSFRINLNIPFNYYNVVAEGNTQFIPLGLGLGMAF